MWVVEKVQPSHCSAACVPVCHIWKQAINWTDPSAPISFVVGSTSTIGNRRRSAASAVPRLGCGPSP